MIKKNLFTYDDATHRGYIDGIPIPSVTQLLKPLEDWDVVPEHILGPARDKGHYRHKMIELYLHGELAETALEQDDKDCLEQFKKFETEHGLRRDDAIIEYQMVSQRGNPFFGTPDIIIDESSIKAIIDIKCGVYGEWRHKYIFPLQLAGYERLWRLNGGSPGKYEHYCLYLYPDNYRFLFCKNKQASQTFGYLLKNWYIKRDYEKKIEQWKNQK